MRCIMEQEYLSVSALTQYLKRKFDYDPYLERVYLTGEISNFRHRGNTHQYFSLKDQGAVISAVMFQHAFKKVQFVPQEGMKVLVIGRVSLFEKSGQYQIYIEHMEPDGVGALYQTYEQLKAKLEQEGLFSRPKKPVPYFPKKIAILTSPSGAVIQDIQTTVKRRFPIVQLVLYPTVVQGEHAVRSILKNLERVQKETDLDVLIIGRGGGSIEDLWCFNEEAVVRKLAELDIPVISSVGHETDVTLTDFVSDVRAATPTAAAELATPVLQEVHEKLLGLKQQLIQNMRHQFILRRKEYERYVSSFVFTKPERMYENKIQMVDQLSMRFQQVTKSHLVNKKREYERLKQRLLRYHPLGEIERYRQQVHFLTEKAQTSIRHFLSLTSGNYQYLVQQLDVLSPLKSLARGYSVVEQEQHVIKSVHQLDPSKSLSLRLFDGQVEATIQHIHADEMKGE